MALVPSPQWLDTGDNAWQLAAATFVGLQSIPGLTVLYGGIVKKKWAINSAFMSMYAFASVLDRLGPVRLQYGVRAAMVSVPRHADAWRRRRRSPCGQATIPAAAAGMPPIAFPMATLVFFQFVFAAITVIILAGSVLGPHELHGLDDLLPGVDDAGLYGRRVQPLGRRLARRPGRRGLLRRLRHPSCRGDLRLCRRLRWSARVCRPIATTSRRTAC